MAAQMLSDCFGALEAITYSKMNWRATLWRKNCL